MFVRLLLCLIVLIIAACSAVAPQHDEVIPLSSEQGTDGKSVFRTQTLWTTGNGSEIIALQVIKIDEYDVGVKYMYHSDFRKLPQFPGSCSFGKRTLVLPPGEYDLLISYTGEGRYMVGSMNQKQSRLISYKATIPADSECAIVSKADNFVVDVHNPRIKLKCRKNRVRNSLFSKILF